MKGKFVTKSDLGTVNRRYGSAGEMAIESEVAGVAVVAFERGKVQTFAIYVTGGVARREHAKLIFKLQVDASNGKVIQKEIFNE